MEYGTILKACRERAGFNQEELAHELHIQQADVSRFENSKKELHMGLFQKWAEVTHSQDVLVAFICGVDGLVILANVLSTMGSAITGFINFLI
ncbi:MULTISPECIES: helix-turn-helix domain-containing protein [Sporosarcina]|uniref:Transcriptional regulator with XRE-family HTH domain n=1 Tax=Sporosarcina psychrophila TaxID=1476 RepID=A0ABV2KB75_SPOPS|nr:helix-turn-helix transcriptional regulator [Sporosarcina sp. resist]QNK86472.1 helix-turn-helix transcriptional regulator [Sporosarcina sp. resist]